MKIKIAFAIMTLLGACTADVVDENESQPATQAQPAQVEAREMPFDHVDPSGRHWTCTNLSRFTVVEEGGVELPEIDSKVATREEVPFEEQSIEVIAEAMRPVTYFEMDDGYTYDCIGDPNYESAQRVKEGYAPPTEGTVDEEIDVAVEKSCCGNDARGEITDPGYFKKVLLGEQGSTASAIGSSTAHSAAHTVYNTASNTWIKVHRTCSSCQDWPWYRRKINLSPSQYDVASCYHVFVPAGWVNATDNEPQGPWSHDYTVIDFSENGSGGACPDATPHENWFGTWNFSDSSWESSTRNLMRTAYPFEYNSTGGSVNSPNVELYIWGGATYNSDVIGGKVMGSQATGSFDVYPYVPTLITSVVDCSLGASGSPLVYKDANDDELITYSLSGNDGTNCFERRWNSTTYTFAEDNSDFPND